MAEAGHHVTVWKLADKASFSATTAYKFLTKDLRLFPYKISIGQVLTEQHKQSRYLFSQWLLKRIEEEPNFLGSIVWSDECSSSLNGHVNRQNYRFWGTEKPIEVLQYPLLEKKLCVFVAFSAKFF